MFRLRILVFLIFIPLFLYSDVSLINILEKNSLEMVWDSQRSIGILEKNNKTLSFTLGQSWSIVNYREKVNIGPIYNKDNEVFFSDEASRYVEDFFSKKKFSLDPMAPRIAAILIDAGHGGKDPGTIGTHNINGKKVSLKEKDIVLDVALQLNRMFKDKYPNKNILLTRSGDTYPSLEDRVQMANNYRLEEHEAIIFISIHVNASLNSKANGYEVWYLPPEYRRDVLDESTLDKDEKDIAPILNIMLEEEYTVESVMLAKNILNGMGRKIGDKSPSRGLKEESWFVVRNAKMPSVLVELGFLTNKKEALLLSDQDYLKNITEGIYNGISIFVDYFENTKGFTE